MFKKIKRMLAFMLQDELIEIVGTTRFPNIRIVEKSYRMETFRARIELDERDGMLGAFPREYERQLRKAKEEMFEAVMPYIEIKSEFLTSPDFRHRRLIELELKIYKSE